MPAELIWASEHLDRGCRIARGVGQVYHVTVEGGTWDLEVPLPTMVVPAGWEPLAVGKDGTIAVVIGNNGRLATWDSGRHDLRVFGRAGFDDGFGRSACEIEPTRFLMVEAMAGLSRIDVRRATTCFRNDVEALRPYESASPDIAYWGGLAKSISAFDGLIAVGGYQLDRVVLFEPGGRVLRAIGPEFEHKGETFSFVRDHPRTVSPYGIEGVFVDHAHRLWVAHDPHEMSVFSATGECLWMSAPDEWDASDLVGPSFNQDWGVDARGWLWCHGGELAFSIPELGAPNLAPARPLRIDRRSGLEPTFGDET